MGSEFHKFLEEEGKRRGGPLKVRTASRAKRGPPPPHRGLTQFLNVGDDRVPSFHVRGPESVHRQDDEWGAHKPVKTGDRSATSAAYNTTATTTLRLYCSADPAGHSDVLMSAHSSCSHVESPETREDGQNLVRTTLGRGFYHQGADANTIQLRYDATS